MTYKQAQLRYGIQERSTILTWLRKHGHLNCALGLPPLSSREWPMSQPPPL